LWDLTKQGGLRAARRRTSIAHSRGRARFEDRQIAELPASSRADDVLLSNDTMVIPARLVGRRMLLDILCRGVGK
jgi:S-adenosylmethionine:tRNA-ribosyltransferase-isomerase (queuine synthetase)